MDMLLAPEQYRDIDLAAGRVRYYDHGDGPPLVFVHGLLVNSNLWRKVIAPLTLQFRCIAPDLPLGAHTLPLPASADLTPGGVAQIVIDLLDALDLRDVTLVGNDTGGAICQLVIARNSSRISRLVLTNCDAFEAFFPPLFNWFVPTARLFGDGFARTLAALLRSRAAQRALLATVSRSKFDDRVLDAYLTPLRHNAAVRHDMIRFLQRVSRHDTLDAARTFGQFDQPVHLLWGQSDFIFSAQLAMRLQRAFPNSTLEWVPRSRAFVPEDQPDVLVRWLQTVVEQPVSG